MKPQVSIIVPVYNVENYLRKCLDSIFAQTFSDWECILVDDGSKDGSGAICDEYAAKDKRFVVVHKQNNGVSKARITAFDLSKGKYVTFIDSDDYVDRVYLEKLFKILMDTDVDFVCCLENDVMDKVILPRKRKIHSGLFKKEDINNILSHNAIFDKETQIAGMPLFLWGKLFKRSLLKKALQRSLGFWYGEDQQAILYLLYHIDSFFILKEYLYNYVHYDTQVTKHFRLDYWDEYYHNWEAIEELDTEHLLDNQLRYRMWKFSSKYLYKVRPYTNIVQYKKIVCHIYDSSLLRKHLFNSNHDIFDVYNNYTTKIKFYMLKYKFYWFFSLYSYLNNLKQ